jgi:hypothetical protein
MKNSLVLNYNVEPVNINKGVLIFKNVINFSEEDVELFLEIINKSLNIYKEIKDKEKNVLWNIFKSNDTEYFIKDSQKILLNCLAKYCDYYPESIHSIQWQERTKALLEFSGINSYVYNPSASKLNDEGFIDNSPFSRQLIAELYIDNTSNGTDFKWIYLDGDPIKMNRGDLIIYPANFLWSKEQSGIISGRRVFLRTAFNGGADFFAEESSHNDEHFNELLYSYLR